MELDMGAMRFFRELAILLVFLFFSAGALLLHDSIVSPGTKQPWDLLAGAFACSLGAFVVYFLFRPMERGYAMRFFRESAILLVFLFFSAGALLLHDSIVSPGTKQLWDLLAGALLCPLGAFVVYFLFRPLERE
jgi:hypothetical protein